MNTVDLARGLLQRVFAGKVISPFRRNDVLRVSRFNELVDCINPFLSLEIKRGSSDNFILSPNKAILQLADATSATEGGGGMIFRGAYSASVNYFPNDVVYTAPDSNTRIVWIALVKNGPANGGAQTPVFPEPGGTVYWRCLAMFKSGGVNYRGLYDGAKDYIVNDLVYTEVTTIGVPVRKPWICEINNDHTSPQAPTWPEPGTVYWRCLATYGDCVPTWHYFQDVNNSCANMKFIYIGKDPVAA